MLSRLNSAAPYNTQARPPISRHWTWCSRIEERTLRIGLGIKGTSKCKVSLLETRDLCPALSRSQPIPLGPLLTHQFFCANHGGEFRRRSEVLQLVTWASIFRRKHCESLETRRESRLERSSLRLIGLDIRACLKYSSGTNGKTTSINSNRYPDEIFDPKQTSMLLVFRTKGRHRSQGRTDCTFRS